MSRSYLFGLALAGVIAAPAVFADGHSTCAKCHDVDEFAGMTTAAIEAGLQDVSIPPHKQFSELTAEQVQAIAQSLSAGDG